MSESRASKYKKGKTKEVTLPSTMENGTHPVFTIKRPSSKALIKVIGILDIEVEEGMDLEQFKKDFKVTRDYQEKIVDVLDIILPEACVSPRVAIDIEQYEEFTRESDDVLMVSDVEMEDQFFLMEEILNYVGFSEKAFKQREKFRKD